MAREEVKYIGEFAVYPGHAITVAYIITCVYPDFESASARTKDGTGCPAALANGEVPGAGGNVYSALSFLRDLCNGVDFEAACVKADEDWINLGRSDNRSAAEIRKGQMQADRIKLLLAQKASWWRKNE